MTRRARDAELAIIISYPTSVSEIILLLETISTLLHLADFAFREQPENNLIGAIS